jgi:arsenate reductase (glutaredoxin)
MYKLFGIPNCDTVKKARDFLAKKNLAFDFVDFKKSPPSLDDISRWRSFFGDFPVNRSGVTYRKHREEFEALSDAKKLLFIAEHSSMIKRPVLEKDGRVLHMGFDEEKYKSFLK